MATATLGGVIAAARRLTELTEPDSDAELLRRFLGRDGARDEAAFALLVTRYGTLVLSACRRIVPDTHLADDAFQATFVVLATKAATLDGRRPLGPWLYAVACQVSVRARAMIGRRRKRETLTGTVPDVIGGTGLRAGDDSLAILDEEIGKLSVAYRDAVVLCELQGLSRRDAARKLGIAEGTLSSRLAAARKALAARLKARGVAAAGITSAVCVPTDLVAAAVAVSTGRIELSAQLMTLVKGGLAMAFVSKLKLGAAVLALAVVLFGVGGVTGPGGTSGEALAAPVPKTAPDPGLIWLLHPPTGKLTAYTPDGKKHKELKLPDGRNFVGFTRDGTGILFIGKNGRMADPDATDGLSLHVRGITEKPEGTDLGLGLQRGDQLILSPDGTRVVRKRLEAVGIGREYTHTLIDRATKKETKIDLPKGSQVVNWSSDGKEWRLIQSDSEIRPNQSGIRWLMYPVAGGKPTPLCEGVSLLSLAASPDGKTFLGTDCPDQRNKPGESVLLAVDGATGKKQELTRFEDVMVVYARWSPDGRKIAAMRYDWPPGQNAPHDARLVVLDADGRNTKELAVFPKDDQKTWLLGWLPTPPPPADPPKKNAPVPEVKGKPKPNYFPHEKGTVWVYQNSLENPRAPKTLLVKEVTAVKADGQDTLVTISQWYTTDPPLPGGPGPVEESEYRVTAAGDVLSVRFGKLVMDPPSLFVRAALKEDDEWEFRRGDVATKYAFKVEKAAELTVPAGTYTAVPLRMLVDGKGTGNVTYYADGVGMVKSASYVLTEFKPGKPAGNPPKKNAPVPKEKDEGTITLLSKTGDKALEVVKPDGTSVKVLTVEDWGNPYSARLSPDGKRLFWAERAPGDLGARFTMPFRVQWLDLEAKQPKPKTIADDAHLRSVAWSPDGKSVYYSRVDPSRLLCTRPADHVGVRDGVRPWFFQGGVRA